MKKSLLMKINAMEFKWFKLRLPRGKEKCRGMDNKKTTNKEGNYYRKNEKSPDERHKNTRENLTDTFRHSRRSFSIRRD